MKIVQFKDGSFGVRKGFWIYQYLSIYDAKNSVCYWSNKVPVHHFYKGTFEEAKKALDWIDDFGKPYNKIFGD